MQIVGSHHAELCLVFPPCDATEHRQIALSAPRQRCILSLGQFRPEKDHKKQLAALRRLQDLGIPAEALLADERFHDVRLVLIGGCRNAEDELRVQELRRIAEDLDLTHSVHFVVNVAKIGRSAK